MTPLSPEQLAKLDALLVALQNMSTDLTIVRCQDAIGLDPRVEDDRTRMDTALAGAWAYDRMLTYLERLRVLNDERKALGNEIRRLKDHPYPTTEVEIDAAAHAWVMAPHLAGRQEVVVNFFCVSVQHIRSLLKVFAGSVGYGMREEDLAFLDEFRHLRNHFEHWYERLPGKTHEAALITRTLTETRYDISGGLQVDEQDRYIVIELKKSGPSIHHVPVTSESVDRVAGIVAETIPKVQSLAIEHVREHYTNNPENIPTPDSLPQGMLIRAGGHERGHAATDTTGE